MTILRHLRRGLAPAVLALGAGLGLPAVATSSADANAVQWLAVDRPADLDAAFARARGQNKPLFLYFGAVWCPPCNQVKATVFNRADFVAQSRQFVAVQLDGDSAGAQKLAARYKVRGYPTMVLFDARGREVTRLPGEVDAPQYMQALQAAAAGARPVPELVAAVRRGEALSAAQWRQLAWYSWDTDTGVTASEADLPALLAQLARACPTEHTQAALRLQLKAAVAAADGGADAKLDESLRFAAGAALLRLLGDGSSAREQVDLVTGYAKELVITLSKPASSERAQLVTAWDQAARRLQADATLSRGDRVGALYARVELARLDSDDAAGKPTLEPGLLADLKRLATEFDRAITEPHERQAVITNAAYVLKQAGLLDESDALLKASLDKTVSPHYLMSQLAGNAKVRGDKAQALDWYRRAWATSKGPATRLQWGTDYVVALIDLAPQDATRIEQTVVTLFNELARSPDAYYERNARRVQRIGEKVAQWNDGGTQRARVARLARALAPVCAQLPRAGAERTSCDKVFAARAATGTGG